MMEKEFNLKKSRIELVRVLREDFGIHNSKAWKIMKLVEEQDQEFLKRFKEESKKKCLKITRGNSDKFEIMRIYEEVIEEIFGGNSE